MRYIINILFAIYLLTAVVYAQYAPQAGISGTTAISSNSTLFTGWATGCNIQRGYQDIAQPSSGYTTSGDSSLALGAADNYTVSLGDSGIAVLTFDHPVYNGPGPDFAVFENGFTNPQNDSQAFLELAFVEVSSDGINYVRFPATSYTQDTPQIPVAGVYMYANLINNLAGKYCAHYGTPFDLNELADSAAIDINNINYIRLVDVIGAIDNHASYDVNGNKINDPYPTAIPTGGFDLDAVGVINQSANVSVPTTLHNISVKAYPNPVTDKLYLSVTNSTNDYMVTLTNVLGNLVLKQKLDGKISEIKVDYLVSGLYYLSVFDKEGNKWMQKISKQ